MDAKDLRTEPAPSDHNNDGSKYTQNGSVLQCNRNKSYQDIGSNSLAKVDVPTARPCAVIGPDRVIPPPVINDAYIKKASVEPWPCLEHTYRRPPEYPQRISNYQNPTRNISPRQTFQENMPRVMVPPTFSSVKTNDDPNFSNYPDRNVSHSKNTKLNLPSEPKYCDVPYTVNPLTNDQKNSRNTEISVSSVNPAISRTAPHGWVPGNVNLRSARVYGASEPYQYPDYPSCGGPRSVPISRPHRTVQEDPPSYVYSDPYYHEANIRFKPYPTPKDIQRYPQPRYDYIGNYSNPFHPPPPFPPYKYELQKPIHPHAYQAYPHLKYLEGRISDPLIEGYQRSPNQQPNYNIAYRNQIIHPPYGPALSTAPQNKMHQYPTDGSVKSIASNKLPYENNSKMYLEIENARNKVYPSASDNFYFNEMNRVHPIRSQVIMANYPSVNMHPMHPYYKKENSPLKNYEYNMSHLKSLDPSMTINNSLLRHPSRFSPGSIAISPSDSNTSIDNLQTQGNLQEDCGYVSQSSTASVRSIETGINRIPNDYYKKYDYRYGPVIRHPSISKPEINQNNNSGSKTNKNINVRQFLQMWNEGEDENNENTKDVIHAGSNDKNNALKHEAKNQEQLYVLGLVNVPREELGKYEHIQQVSKLPENIKGYSSIELLNQFEEAIESSNINCHKPPTPREYSMLGKGIISKQTPDIIHRPLSPLDVEAKISQSVIHKEVGCNFEIKPCSPKMLNVEIAAPVQNILGERLIEKVANPHMMRSPIVNGERDMDSYNTIKRQDHRLNLSEKVPSCKMVNTQFTTDHSMKTNYSLHDLESNSGVCLASLPRLDNDIELSFPEVNQQFINANKGESKISLKDLPALDATFESEKTNSKDYGVLQECDSIQQFSPIIETEKEFVKLSKYRKSKSNATDFKDDDLQNKNVVRTDSVIIKNPDNIKSYDISIGCTTKNESFDSQQAAINLSSHCNVINREDKFKLELTATDQSNDTPNDVAIDFSLNKQALNYAEIKKNNEFVEHKYPLENFDNKSTTTQNLNKEEFENNCNTIDNEIICCDENEIQTKNYTDIVEEEKYVSENDIEMVDFITNPEKSVVPTSASIIKNIDNNETDNINTDCNISIIAPKSSSNASPNASDLFQNNNELESIPNPMNIDNENNENNISEVFAENEIEQAIEPKEKDSLLSENQNEIEEKALLEIKTDGLYMDYDNKGYPTTLTETPIIESKNILDNVSEVLAETEIDQTVTSNKATSLLSVNQDVAENTLLDGVFKNDNMQVDTNDTIQLAIAESDKTQDHVSDVLPTSEVFKIGALNEENPLLSENQDNIENTLFDIKAEGLLNKNYDQELTINSTQLSNPDGDKVNDIPKVIPESEIEETNSPKKNTVNKDLLENNLFHMEDNMLCRHSNNVIFDSTNNLSEVLADKINHAFTSIKEQSVVEHATMSIEEKLSLFEDHDMIETRSSSVLISEKRDENPIDSNESQQSCSDLQIKLIDVETVPKNDDMNVSQIISEESEPCKTLCSEKDKNLSQCKSTLTIGNQYLLWNEQCNSPNMNDINDHQNFAYEQRCEDGQESNVSGPNNSITKLLLDGTNNDQSNATSEVYGKCSKALYSPWIQKLLLHSEGRCSNILNKAFKFDARDILEKHAFFNSDCFLDDTNNICATESCIEEPNINTELETVLSDKLLKDTFNEDKLPDKADVVFSDLNELSIKKINLECSSIRHSNLLHESNNEIEKSDEVVTSKESFSSKMNCDEVDTHLELDNIGTNCLNDDNSECNLQSFHQTDHMKLEVSTSFSTHTIDSAMKDNTEVHADKVDEKIVLENKKEPHEFPYKNRLSLKRSLSDSAINVTKNDCSQDSVDNTLKWSVKRKKSNIDNTTEADLIAENVRKILQNNRRNSLSSSIYTEENVSICIFIDNDCIITEENDEEEKVCFTELPNDCLPECNSDLVNEEQNTDLSTDDISCFEEKSCEFIPFNQCPILEFGECEKAIDESWVDDVACVETVVSDDIAEDVEISAPSTPKCTDSSDNDESGIFSNCISDHTDKVKYIYGDKMCSDDALLVEKLYRTPQMNVNKTLINKGFHANEEYTNYYDKESLEKILSDSNSRQGSPIHSDNVFVSNDTINTPDDKENVDIRNISPSLNLNDFEIENVTDNERKNMKNVYSNVIDEELHDITLHSCESSIDGVFTYNQRDETNSLTSSSPEVSSTTSEEKGSGIMLKITKHKGSIISQINERKTENFNKLNCTFAEPNDFTNLPIKPLITKGAQKYIPPLRESIRDLKVKLSLPQHSLIKLKQMKKSKDEPKQNKHVNVPKSSMKPKPKFEDVLKSIDEIQFKMHKEKGKKPKKTIPKVVIKKAQNGSHYASTSNNDVYNPDLTGRKWQPWVFLEKNTFIDKMATKKNNRAIFNYRRNTYVLAEKFRKYKSVSSTKFVITQPKLDDSCSGHLKYTIKLKHTY